MDTLDDQNVNLSEGQKVVRFNTYINKLNIIYTYIHLFPKMQNKF